MSVVRKTKARSTGAIIEVVDNRERSYMDDDNRWYTVCIDHGSLVGHTTRALAVSWSAEPESWCEQCQERAS
jgi:hypothetical protein